MWVRRGREVSRVKRKPGRRSGCGFSSLGAGGRWLVWFLVLSAPACGGTDDAADARPPIPIGPPDVVFPQDFGYVHAVRELPGGDVLVADPLNKALYRVDMEAGVRTAVGRRGEGPEEYEQPDAVWPLQGDSTLLVDLGNGRLVRLGPELKFGEMHSIAIVLADGTVETALPGAADLQGNVYTAASGPPDDDGRGSILRISLASGTSDTVGTFKRRDMVVREIEGGISMSPIPLSSEDAWGVAPDGSVVVARSQSYGVDWYLPDGIVIRGDTVAYEPVPITTAEKAEYFRDMRRHVGIGYMMSTGSDGSMIATFSRGGFGGGASEEPDYDNYTWPNVKSALHPMTVRVDPLGRAWVRRHVPAGTGTRYDLFDRQGRLARALTLEGDRVVAGFGRESVYMVTFGDLDLAYLERYGLP